MINKHIKTKIIDKAICEISLSREPVNALNTKLLDNLNKVFNDLESDSTIRIIILKSTLNHFSAGADLKQRSIMSNNESKVALDAFKNCFNRIENSSKITIACINGYCLGGGAELSLCFDLRVATEDAIIGFPEVSIGIIPGAGGTQRLPRIIGVSNAKYWIYTAKKFTAYEALKYNFVNFVYKSQDIGESIFLISKNIIDNSPYGVRCSKKAIDSGYLTDIKKGLKIERNQYNISVNTEDRKDRA